MHGNQMKDHISISSLGLAAMLLLSACGSDGNGLDVVSIEINSSSEHYINIVRSGGDTTDIEYSGSTHAFSQPAANLSAELLALHLTGDAHFETSFIGTAVSGSTTFDGLGPVQNHTNCNACHQRDGRANLPYLPDQPTLNSYLLEDDNGYFKIADAGLFLRISIENETYLNAPKTEANLWGSPMPVPGFGDQLFQRGSIGLREAGSEGSGLADMWMTYEYSTFTYPDDTSLQLSLPIFVVDNPYDAPDDPNRYNPILSEENATSRLFREDVVMGARIGMPMIGLGLLQTINEEDILSRSDINDTDGDGISGKPNWVFDKEKYDLCSSQNSCEENPPISLGRFGWKANTPTVAHQGLGALRGDMGVTNPLFRQESISGTSLLETYKAANDQFYTFEDTNQEEDLDADLAFAQALTLYSETLSVPPRRDINQTDVQIGGMLFEQIGCVKCHTPSFTTGTNSGSYATDGARIAALENQKIYPFTDMLLHDMGDGLADGRRDFDADGREWKTRPLWGIGLTKLINPGAGFLHDGRARTLEEAIIWHGGEAEEIRDRFAALSKTNRDALITFLNSL